jgi:rare lipoprotein A
MRRTLSLWALALTASATSLAIPPAEARMSSATDFQVAVRDIQAAPAADFGTRPSVMPLPFTPPSSPATNLRLASVSQGTASWYGPGFYGNRTANGEVFRPGTLTAAHRSLPFGTRVRVTNLNNGRSTVVRINDRGPFHGGRVIDLAQGAAQQLGVTSSGVAPVRLEVLR